MYDDYRDLKIEKRDTILVITMANPPLNAATPRGHTELAHLRRNQSRLFNQCGSADRGWRARVFSGQRRPDRQPTGFVKCGDTNG